MSTPKRKIVAITQVTLESGVPPRGFTLVESRSTPSGILANTYRPKSRR